VITLIRWTLFKREIKQLNYKQSHYQTKIKKLAPYTTEYSEDALIEQANKIVLEELGWSVITHAQWIFWSQMAQ